MALLLFFLLTEGIPWVRQYVEGITREKIAGRPSAMADDSTNCVHQVNQANAYLGQQLGHIWPPPGDASAWRDSTREIQNRISEAARTCACSTDACRIGREALDRIRSLVGDIDLLVGGDGRFAGTLARQQEEINALIDQAGALSR
ncbi:MAG: hypothetical protein O7A04_00095 [Acidobacteria bacterium]|nr:hypothetical protein [Acidobacteriota bacterium]